LGNTINKNNPYVKPFSPLPLGALGFSNIVASPIASWTTTDIVFEPLLGGENIFMFRKFSVD